MHFLITYRFFLGIVLFSLLRGYCIAQEKTNFIKLNRTFDANLCIEEDALGYTWFASSQGLYKYDGYNFSNVPFNRIFGEGYTTDKELLLVKDAQKNFWISTFKGELTKLAEDGAKISFKNKLTSNQQPLQVTSISSGEKNVWFGAVNGVLFRHDLSTSSIDSITVLPRINNSPQAIKTMALTAPGEVWIGTPHSRIYNYSVTSGKLTLLSDPAIRFAQATKLAADKKGRLWIATELQGLFSYNPATAAFTSYDKPKSSSGELKHDMFISIFCDSHDVIWAGTDGDGLYKVDPQQKKVSVFKHDNSNKFSIGNNTILKVSEDSHGNIWTIGKTGEVNILPPNSNSIRYYSGSENNTPTRILSILKTTDGSLWLGTDGNGLNRVLPGNSSVQYNNTKKGKYFFEGKYVQSLLEDANGNVWIATYQRGLWVYDRKSGTFSKVEFTDLSGRSASDVRFLFKDSKNRVWATSGLSINIFSDRRKKLAGFEYDSIGSSEKISHAICEDNGGNIWVGINKEELYKFRENHQDLGKSQFAKKEYFKKEEGDLFNYNIQSLTPVGEDQLWILCASGILIKYNVQSERYESLAQEQLLDDINISAILFESPGDLWLSSRNGVHHYQPDRRQLRSYYLVDGLQGNLFRKRSAFKDQEGVFYFGGRNGVSAFLPREMDDKESSPRLYINDIEVLNRSAELIIPNQVKGRTEYVEKIRLASDQSSFSFQFSAIDNVLNSSYHYAYRLKGFDKDWIIPKQARVASYTNIPSGSYVFQVKAGSKKGQWDIEPQSIDVFVKAPWWLSPFAFVFYFILGTFMVFGFVVWFRLKNKLAKEEWQSQKDKELYAMKMNFFAKMSHEIQTPLALILGPIEDMVARAEGNQLLKQRLQIINNNARRLSRIANELMTVRNKELGKLRIYASKNNLTEHLKSLALSFAEQARFKNIDFIQQYPEEEIKVWYDKDKVEHIIYNLLSNAFKFTPREGNITIKVISCPGNESVEIKIIDSGPGISEEELEDIFELFYQADLGRHARGIGVGLALTKELISMHHGDINVTSSPEEGTCFAVALSTNENIFSEDEKTYEDQPAPVLTHAKLDDLSALKDRLSLGEKQDQKRHTLLVVEDNVEMQMLLRDLLDGIYNLLIAENGEQGITLAEKNNPDLIISDMAMPVMDGIEMSKTLQKRKSTSHIPIILITARNSSKGKILGLKTGAIEYIQKPFNFQELLLRINNIISAKEKIVSKYRTDSITEPKEEVVKSKDDVFIENLVFELNQQIENPGFRLEELSKPLCMSYSVIYRKCYEITGKTVVEFARSLKLKRAAFLITKQGYNISEAAFMVGFKDPKYFTKCFKEEFGKTPAYFKKFGPRKGLEL